MAVRVGIVESRSSGGANPTWRIIFLLQGNSLSTKVEVSVSATTVADAETLATKEFKAFIEEVHAAAKIYRPGGFAGLAFRIENKRAALDGLACQLAATCA
jgi:hypothetical protein